MHILCQTEWLKMIFYTSLVHCLLVGLHSDMPYIQKYILAWVLVPQEKKKKSKWINLVPTILLTWMHKRDMELNNQATIY